MLFQTQGSSRDHTVTVTQPHPLFYWVDADKSGKYTETWIDPEGKGQCQDIVKYWAQRD